MARQRSILTEAQGTGQSCGELLELAACNTAPCAAGCGLADWQDWGDCSKTCDDGQHTRARDLVSSPPADQGGASTCGAVTETRTCNLQVCQHDCKHTDWSDWTTCTKTCGTGSQRRARTITREPTLGGQACPDMTEAKNCGTDACVQNEATCLLSDWSKWGACSVTCGGGTHERTRKIKQHPSDNAPKCSALEEMGNCNMQMCDRDCDISEWDSWGACEKIPNDKGETSCTRTKKRYAKDRTPWGAGAACPVLEEFETCDQWECTGVITGGNAVLVNLGIVAGLGICGLLVWRHYHTTHLGHAPNTRGIEMPPAPPGPPESPPPGPPETKEEAYPLLNEPKGDFTISSWKAPDLLHGLGPQLQTFPQQGMTFNSAMNTMPRMATPMTSMNTMTSPLQSYRFT